MVEQRFSYVPVVVLLTMLVAPAAAAESPVPYSCRLLHDEQRKCGFGACDKRVIDRLTKECLRDGGRP